MIHVRNQLATPDDNSVIHISIVGMDDITSFKSLLDRALNCADPHKNATWVELSDGLERYIRARSVQSTNT